MGWARLQGHDEPDGKLASDGTRLWVVIPRKATPPVGILG